MVQFEVPPIVPADPQANVTDLLVERVKKTPDGALFAVPEGDGWRDITAAEFQRQVIALAKGFVAAGLEPGDKVGFIARTTYEWTLVDFALFFAGAVMVPIYETNSPAQIALEPHRLGRRRLHHRASRSHRAPRRGAGRAPAHPLHVVDARGRPREARRAGQGCSGCRDRAPSQHRERVRHRDAHLHVRFDRAPEGLRADAQQLRRALPQLGQGAERGRRGARGVDAAVHHDRAHLRPLHLDPRDPRGREDRSPARHEEPAAGARLVQADLPAGRSARVREGLQLGRAEGRSGRQGQDLPRGGPHRRRALEAPGGGQEGPARHEDQVRAVRPSRLQQAPRGHGRQRRVRRVGFRAARPAPRALLPQPRRRHPRGLRPHRDDGSGDGQPRDQVEDRHRGARPARRRRPARRGRRDRGPRHQRVQGVLEQPRGDRRDVRRRLVQDRRHRHVRRRGLPDDHRPQEGDHRHGRREERRARRARGPHPRQPHRRTGRRRRRQAAVHLGARHARQRDAPDLARQQRPARRHAARRGREEQRRPRRGAAGDRRRPTRTSRARSRSASSRSCRRSGARRAVTSRPR